MTLNLGRLAHDAALEIARGARTDSPGERAEAYHRAAEILVTAREAILDDAGEPDWRGRTYAYRTWNGNVWAEAGVTGDERRTAQAAVRYHVGNVLRERLDEETLEGLGLRVESPRERSVLQRQERSALLKSVTGSSTGFRSVDGLKALLAAESLLERVETPTLADLSTADRQAARRAAKACEARCAEALEVLSRRRR